MLFDGLLIGCMIIAVYCDLRWRRIPNWVIVSGLLTGLFLQVLSGGGTAVGEALQGLAVGLALLFIPFVLGGMGAGDVKLLGLVGAVKGTGFVVQTFLWMALWGGLMALGYLAVSGRLWVIMANMAAARHPSLRVRTAIGGHRAAHRQVTIPYGVAIGMGVVSSMIWMWW